MKVNGPSFNQYKVNKAYQDGGGSGQKNQQQKKEEKHKLKKRRSTKSSAAIFAALNSAELIITPKLEVKDRILELSKICSLTHVLKLKKLLENEKEENEFLILKTFLTFIKSSNDGSIINGIIKAITPHSNHEDIRIRLLIVMIFKEIRLKNIR